MIDLTLILPVLNEENIIQPVVDDLIKVLDGLNINYEIILVENESEDNTWQKILQLEKKDRKISAIKTTKGYGNTIIFGLSYAHGENVCYMPSDGQIDAQILAQLWELYQTKKYDVVKIRRINRESNLRFIRSKIFNILASWQFKLDIKDINGSPRILSLENAKILHLKSKDSFIDTEFAVKAKKLNWKIKEIPMKNLNRLGGKSTVKLSTIKEFINNIFYYRYRENLLKWQPK